MILNALLILLSLLLMINFLFHFGDLIGKAIVPYLIMVHHPAHKIPNDSIKDLAKSVLTEATKAGLYLFFLFYDLYFLFMRLEVR